ncbi:ATP-binding protein [Aureimonas sp. Leaf324]|uniref:ATP-binding protein n=1 Tax=Aureimonas sp. Leaf324 TaxID=1736336 RepID=UPI000ACC5324|nr:ATP-binding protein [Aureimonas sp. Leaf324]
MLPIFEAISNSLHAILESSSPLIGIPRIDIEVYSSPLVVRVRDNGPGLNVRNFDEFRTPFTGHKLRKGGKGFGRFIASKVFDSISYDSQYMAGDGASGRIAFDFKLVSQNEFQFRRPFDPKLRESGCTVEFSQLRKDFQWVEGKITAEDFIDSIVRYFLPYFATGRMPNIAVNYNGTTYDPRDRFSEAIKSDTTSIEMITVNGELLPFEIGVSKSPKGSLFNTHSILFFADDRIIGSGRNIERKIGAPFFLDDQGKQTVAVITVKSDYLDTRANNARTDIEAPEAEIDEIVSHVTSQLLLQEKDFVQRKRSTQRTDVVHVLKRNPLLRASLHETSLDDYISSKPMSWSAEEFVSDLSLRRYRKQSSWEREIENVVKDPKQMEDRRRQLLDRIEQENRDSLAAYVVHRRTVIDIAQKAIGIQPSGKMSLEDVFHDLVHPRHQDIKTTKFYEHNLWLIDDRLSFVSYLSSDRTIHGGRRSLGDKVADLVFFDDCSVYRNKDESSLVLIEFKRPGRDDYRFGPEKSDPVTQVVSTSGKIRETKSLIATDGSRIAVPDGTKIFAYIVADLEPSLVDVYESHDFDETWDRNGYYKYHDKKDIFIEALSYEKLIDNAKKRNTAFFDVLMGDIL